MMTTFVNVQNSIFDCGLFASVRALFFCVIGRIIRIKIESIRASTPPSLFGMERRMA